MIESNQVSVLQLRRLLTELKEHRPDICVRYRLMGQMWVQHFAHVRQLTDQGVVLAEEHTDKLVSIPELSAVIQFEIDKSFQSYQPYFHYSVVIQGEWA